MLADLIAEARRQAEICNACRYCEGYCSVFPALHRERAFSDGDITHLANLCHNCRGCYYACQYTAPHEFDLNLPRALAEVRQDSWKAHAWPAGFANLFDRSGVAMAALLSLGFALMFALSQGMRPENGAGFYAYMSHGLMAAIFAPAFLLPLAALAVSLRGYWRTVGGGAVRWADLRGALASAGRMRNLKGGHGDGCNFEDEDRFSHARRHFHQATLYGFLLCFASTSSGTVLHYVFGVEAPYGLFSLPKLLGLPGGFLLCVGTAGLAWLKTKADPGLGAPSAWGGEMAFVLLLFVVSATGLILYAATGTAAVAWLLPLHLGTVLTLFLLTPYSKMAHGFYRLAALTREASRRPAEPV
ncbi:tricarballylate utilization 4Fe-4S protein TcuB [Meridianimarinicoccus roseus]|uniref:Tricarballylate utilization 4Fe-4S protein TcuB n=2 Tax=Meridianimarinicoccus roseus TaxID=2072018 RepID=A0A2V2L5T0_9RHOB|nr:tricarballylate utilization 4Fe-4S protein TcuB [Meridianimarinicoccus roseus]PWR00748.1 tricarballylate utilization 4Fe-4S protein TcuB [Meridianimarinicoccus roseus]